MNKAVFLDRDGVINSLVYYPDWDEFESPRNVDDLYIYPHVPFALKLLKEAGYYIFIVSNQPSYAKGKTSMEDIVSISGRIMEVLTEAGNLIDKQYYCYHHPNAVIEKYRIKCRCRKPDTLLLEQAVDEFSLKAEDCCFIGDQDSDIFCGQAMGFRTIKIDNPCSANKSGKSNPDYYSIDLLGAAMIVYEKERASHEIWGVHRAVSERNCTDCL